MRRSHVGFTSMVAGCVLALGLTACDNTFEAPGSTDSPSPGGPGDGDYSVQNALAILPDEQSDEPVLIVTGDLDAATELSGLERPENLDDPKAIAAWVNPLTGVPGEGNDPAPIFVPFANGFRIEFLLAPMSPSFDEELGWSVVDTAWFAERQTPPTLFTVVSGDFDSSTFPDDLPEVADGVVTAGEGDDFAQDLQDKTAARPLGTPLRMAIQDSFLAAAPSTDEVVAWLGGKGESFAEDGDLAAVAEALDNAGAVSAVISSGAIRSLNQQFTAPDVLEELKSEHGEAIPDDPFETVGIGWSVQDGESVITVAIKFDDDSAADDAIGAFEEMFASTPSLLTGQKLSTLYSFQEASSDGSVAVVTLSPGEEGGPITIYNALMAYDLPFTYE